MHNVRITVLRTLVLGAVLFSGTLALAACESNGSNGATSSPTPSPRESAPRVAWAEQAESVCSGIYNSRGRPERSESGNINDDMALAEMWHSSITTKAADGLQAISDTPLDGVTLINGLRTYAALSLKLADVYAEGGYQPNKLNDIESQRGPVKQEVQRVSASLGAPSCGLVVDTPE